MPFSTCVHPTVAYYAGAFGSLPSAVVDYNKHMLWLIARNNQFRSYTLTMLVAHSYELRFFQNTMLMFDFACYLGAFDLSPDIGVEYNHHIHWATFYNQYLEVYIRLHHAMLMLDLPTVNFDTMMLTEEASLLTGGCKQIYPTLEPDPDNHFFDVVRALKARCESTLAGKLPHLYQRLVACVSQVEAGELLLDILVRDEDPKVRPLVLDVFVVGVVAHLGCCDAKRFDDCCHDIFGNAFSANWRPRLRQSLTKCFKDIPLHQKKKRSRRGKKFLKCAVVNLDCARLAEDMSLLAGECKQIYSIPGPDPDNDILDTKSSQNGLSILHPCKRTKGSHVVRRL